MSVTEGFKDKVVDYVTALGFTAVVVGGTWGFYMALKLLFA